MENQIMMLLKAFGGSKNILNLAQDKEHLLVFVKDVQIVQMEDLSKQFSVTQNEECFKVKIEDSKDIYTKLKNKIMLDSIPSVIIDVFSPLAPLMILYGLTMTLFQLCVLLPIHLDGYQSFLQILSLISHCTITVVPFALLVTISKRFSTSEILAITVGLSMTLSAFDPAFSQIKHFNGQIVPAVLAGLFLVFIEKTLKQYVQGNFKKYIVPILSLVITIVVVQMLIGPIASDINHGIAQILAWCFTSEARFLMAPALSLIFYFLAKNQYTAFLIPFDLIMMAEFGYTYLWPLIAIVHVSFVAVTYFQTKGQNIKEALFQQNIQPTMELTMVRYAIFSGALACLFASFFQVRAYSIGFYGVLSFLCVVVGLDDLTYALALFISILVPFYIMTNPEERKAMYQKIKEKIWPKKENTDCSETPNSKELIEENEKTSDVEEVENAEI